MLVMYLKRIWVHLTRRQSLMALVVALAAGLLAREIGPETPTGQVLIVLIGLCVSVATLPEQPHRLWNVSDQDLADMVPGRKIVSIHSNSARAYGMQTATVDSVTSMALADYTTTELQEMFADPRRIIRNFHYAVTVYPEGDPDGVSVTIRYSADRMFGIQKAHKIWFSYCQDTTTLSEEFSLQDEGCISRELVPKLENESETEWQERVSGYRADFEIGGRTISSSGPEEREGVVRFNFDLPTDLDYSSYQKTHLNIEFKLPPGSTSFPLKLSSYYVVGSADVDFKVVGADYGVEVDEYFSTVNRPFNVTQQDHRLETRFHLSTEADTVIPPGSGAVMTWFERSKP